jgi:hypothetical protein
VPKRPKTPKINVKKINIMRGRDKQFPKLFADFDPELYVGYNYRRGGGRSYTRKSKGFTSIRKGS